MPRIRRLVVDPQSPDAQVLGPAADTIRGGGVVAIPTDTFYALAVDPFNRAAVARIFSVKQRGADRAVPLVAADVDQVRRWLGGGLAPIGARLAERFWPGQLTLLVPAPSSLAAEVTRGTGKVGVRVPAHKVTRAVCELCGRPLTATSANVSGQPATDEPDDVEASIGSRIDMLVDAGRTAGGPASTIVDVTGDEALLVRSGAVSWEDVQRCLSLV